MDSTRSALGPSRGLRPSAALAEWSAPHPARPTAPIGLPLSDWLYQPIADALQQVERRLRQELDSQDQQLAPVLRHGALLGGKRLRPALVLLAAAATGEIGEDHVVIGTVIEMVHTATLVHDDVLDGASHRRHRMTVNALWDQQTSILLGDYLFAQSFQLAATLGSTEACRWIGEASRRVCEGELRQVFSRGDTALSEAAYLQMIRGKTAELCRVACRLGAVYAGATTETAERLDRFGEAVGIAFQIADDYLDLWGDDRQVGKTLGTDLQQGKLTLPLIRLLATTAPDERAKALRILSAPPAERLEAIMPLLERSDARQYTLDRAEQYAAQAIESLTPLADTAAKTALVQIARFAIDRRC